MQKFTAMYGAIPISDGPSPAWNEAIPSSLSMLNATWKWTVIVLYMLQNMNKKLFSKMGALAWDIVLHPGSKASLSLNTSRGYVTYDTIRNEISSQNFYHTMLMLWSSSPPQSLCPKSGVSEFLKFCTSQLSIWCEPHSSSSPGGRQFGWYRAKSSISKYVKA